VTHLVFIDVDDTLLTPPYEAVRRVATMLGKTFPPEEAFATRKSIHFHEAFPHVFRSAAEMWAIALMSLPFGYFTSHKAMPLDIKRMSEVLSDHRVYLISKNPPSFTRWRVRRLEQLFSVPLSDRYIACGPIIGKGESKLSVMRRVAEDRGVDIKNCLLIDDSVENVREANQAGIAAALIRSTWNESVIDELNALPMRIPAIETQDIANIIKSHLGSSLQANHIPRFIVPPLSVRTAIRLGVFFGKRWWMYNETLPHPNHVVPLARNRWTSLMHADPHAVSRERLRALVREPAVLRSTRIVSTGKNAAASLLPLDATLRLASRVENENIRSLQIACKKVMEKRGNRIVSDAKLLFTALDRSAEISRILKSNRVLDAARRHAEKHNLTAEECDVLARRYAREITAGRTYLGCTFGHLAVSWVTRKSFKMIRLHSHPKVAELQRDHFLLFASTHRSYLDSGILYNVLAETSTSFPFIVAADKMRKMWLGKLGVVAGALFLQRRFVDEIYAAVLAENVSRMQGGGASLEVFLEGQRSRSGLTLPPKKGIASIIWQNIASTSERKDKVAIVPVSFSYNKLPESELLLRESFDERQKSGLASLREASDIKIKTRTHKSVFKKFRANLRRLRSSPVSECYIRFAEPIILERNPLDTATQDSARLQHNLNETMFRINANTEALPSSILCLGVLSSPDHHINRPSAIKFVELAQAIFPLYKLPHGQHILQNSTAERHVYDFVKLPFVNRKFKRHRVEERDTLCISDLDIERATYYKNNVLHFFVLPSLLSSVLLDSRAGRVEELHRFFDHMFEKMRVKYFLPSAVHAKTFIDDLLQIFAKRDLVVLDGTRYVANLHAPEAFLLQILARQGEELMQDDLSDLLAAFRRNHQRVDLRIPSQLVGIACTEAFSAQVTGLSENGFFLKCANPPEPGAWVQFTADAQPKFNLAGTVVRKDLDGVAIRLGTGSGARSAADGGQSERRTAPRSTDVIAGVFTHGREVAESSEVTNLSPSGAFISTELHFNEGDMLSCVLQADDGALRIQGKVTRTTQAGVGIRFHGLSPQCEAKLRVLVSDLGAAPSSSDDVSTRGQVSVGR
jgi:hypothetical protein